MSADNTPEGLREAEQRNNRILTCPKCGIWSGPGVQCACEPDAGDVGGLSEALVDALAPSLYEALMEATADSWRRWEYLTADAREQHRLHAAHIVADALAPVLATRTRMAAEAGEKRGAERALREVNDVLASAEWYCDDDHEWRGKVRLIRRLREVLSARADRIAGES